MSSFGLSRVRIRGCRSARDLSFAPGPLCALVGEAGSGKSNVLSALWRLLSAQTPPLEEADFSENGDGRLVVEASFGGQALVLESRPPGAPVPRGKPPPALFLPAALRSDEVVASARALSGTGVRMLELLVAHGAAEDRPRLQPSLSSTAWRLPALRASPAPSS